VRVLLLLRNSLLDSSFPGLAVFSLLVLFPPKISWVRDLAVHVPPCATLFDSTPLSSPRSCLPFGSCRFWSFKRARCNFCVGFVMRLLLQFCPIFSQLFIFFSPPSPLVSGPGVRSKVLLFFCGFLSPTVD